MMSFTIRSIDQLIAAVPHMVGYSEIEGLVCVPVGTNKSPMSRLDHPVTPAQEAEAVGQLVEVYARRHPAEAVTLLAFGEDAELSRKSLDLVRAAFDADPDAPEVLYRIAVTEQGWTDLDRGVQQPHSSEAKNLVDAEMVVRGYVMPTGNRDSVVDRLRGDASAVDAVLPAAIERLDGMNSEECVEELRWLQAKIAGYREAPSRPSDQDAARMLALISVETVRADTVLRMDTRSAHFESGLWEDLSARTPAGLRDAPLTLAAVSAYMAGQSTVARMALNELQDHNPLARAVDHAMTSAIPPERWEAIVRTLPMAMSGRPGSLPASPEHLTRRPGFDTPRPDSSPDR